MIRRILSGILLLFAIAIGIGLFFYLQFKPAKDPSFGITFSDVYAESLGFDPMTVYMDMLTDLKPKKIRLVAYWDQIEKNRGQYDFKRLDEMLTEAQNRKVDVILTLGKKVPRWPECHQPDWYKDLDAAQQQQALLNMITNAVNHVKHYGAIKSWQIENEPYFVFGIDCPKQNQADLLKEVKTVKDLDKRPVILTGSGEQGDWNQLPKAGADIVGVTMYRTVYSDRFGYYKYPIGPWFYRMKAGYLKYFKNKPVIGVELQTEPWLLSGIFHTDVAQQKTLMNAKVFEANVAYARKAGFQDNYLWGVEWWYWMAKKQNDWGMWAYAKDLLAGNK
ncbi:MAG: beta-galactosidase [Candidatus Doudnabacteria bacterium]|nr:beta-galactosidase [Candidatus Doudnabacteria bacterium]